MKKQAAREEGRLRAEAEYPAFCREYLALVHEDLDARWRAWNIDLTRVVVHEVVGGLLARQVSLASHMARTTNLWTGHVGPLVLRAMCDVHINVAWILKSPDQRAQQFYRYGLGQEKLYIEHLKAAQDTNDEMVRYLEARLSRQRFPFLTEVNVGDWADLDTRKRAAEVGCSEMYNFAFQPWSQGVHSTWVHLEEYNLDECPNPLHRHHRIPVDSDPPPDIGFLENAARYLDLSFDVFDKSADVSVGPPRGHARFLEFVDHCTALPRNPARSGKKASKRTRAGR